MSSSRASRFAAFVLLTAGGATSAVACSDGKGGASGTGAAAGTGSSSAPPASTETAPEKTADDEVKPVYPLDGSPPDPLVQRFCQAVHDVPARRKGECCGTPGETGYFTGECTRTLSSAVRSGAAVLDAAGVDRCVEAMAKDLDGCGWVGPSSPAVPAACEGIIAGQTGERALCRSSLECSEGLTCQGLTATRTGKCFPPKRSGIVCGGSTDTLAALTRQNQVAVTHPECAGYCNRPVCTDKVAFGAACKIDDECGLHRTCLGGKCSETPLPAVGQACTSGRCAAGARCVKDLCAAPGAEGAACESDLECRGACEKAAGAAAGKCGKRCVTMTIPTKPAFSARPRLPPPR